MNFYEALYLMRDGECVIRNGWLYRERITVVDGLIALARNGMPYAPTVEDLTAEDWQHCKDRRKGNRE